MTQVSSDPITNALSEFLAGRNAELAKQIDSVSEAGLNWRPGKDTNSIFEILNHALDVERGFVVTITGSAATFERRANRAGTVELAQARLREADTDMATLLSASATVDPAREVTMYRQTMTAAHAMALGIGHLNEHLGHLSLTRQLWDEHGQTGALAGAEPSERYSIQ